jgi:hypothetical protein
MATGAGYALLLCALAGAAFWLGAQADNAVGVGTSIAEAQGGGRPNVTDRANRINGQTVGEVLVNGQIVIRMRTSAGGFSAPERARIVAERIRNWVSDRFSPYDLAVRRGAGGAAELRAHGTLIVDVNPAEARALGSSAMGLAQAWQTNIQTAMGVTPSVSTPVTGGGGGQVGSGAQGGGRDDYDWRNVRYEDKIVPILSIGGSTAIGMARVNGPQDRVRDVIACTQLEMRWRGVLEIDIYVPVRTRGGLDRVQQVGVTGLLDIEI